MICEICEREMTFRWTDTHGVGACTNCGAPYTIYHYGDDGNRVDRPPKMAINDAWVPLIKRYWTESGRNCSPGAFNMPGSSYEVASQDDFATFNRWMKDHEADIPNS